MIEKKLQWIKLPSGVYRVDIYTDDSVLTLSLLFEDGLGFQDYIDFFENIDEDEFFGNICVMRKKSNKIVLDINEYVFPGLPSFETKTQNMIEIMKKYRRFLDLNAERIEIIIDESDQITITGD